MRPDACEQCGLDAPRREFIRTVGLAVAAALASLGIAEPLAAAVPISAVNRLSNAPSHTYPLPAADGAQIDRKAEVILVRWEGAVYAFNLSCPHQYTALRWIDKDHRFKCPKHNSRYQPDGTFVDGRATRGMDRFAIAFDGTNVVVNVDQMFKQDVDAKGWSAAMVRVP